MTPSRNTDIKFTPFGIPYIPEFENVSFAPEQNHPHHRCSFSSSSESFCYVESPPTRSSPRPSPFSLRSASSLFKRKASQPIQPPLNDDAPATEVTKPPPPPPPPPKVDVSEPHGIYIRFPPGHCHPQMSRKQRLIHLQKTISIAVLDAGMSRSPGNTSHPESGSSDDLSHRTRGHRSPDVLFCGTYGQLMTALQLAGLSAAPCSGDGLSGHTRLGALFVARNSGTNVQLRKITLWG